MIVIFLEYFGAVTYNGQTSTISMKYGTFPQPWVQGDGGVGSGLHWSHEPHLVQSLHCAQQLTQFPDWQEQSVFWFTTTGTITENTIKLI